ncbi:MAG: hypothetical protein AB1801_02900, partial [Chloroflexota bacterium]
IMTRPSAPERPLTYGAIFWFWLPLAASWALMTLEGPTIQATIARLPQATTMLAAAGIVLSMEVTIESPIIMLLATSTALVRTPQAYRLLRRFVLHLTLLLTVIAAAVAFVDPVYHWLIPGLMGIPAPIAEAAQPAMQIMTLWSAAIGWRRFYQGLLIRFGRTRQVGYGTAVRLAAVVAAAVTLAVVTDWPGVVVGGCVWMVGVVSELGYAYGSTRPTITAHLSGPVEPDRPPLTYRQIMKYHTPLAATSLLSLLIQPLIGAGLARMALPTENLAAWPIVFSVLLFFRSFGFALQEVIIALYRGPDSLVRLRRFCLGVAAASSLVLALIAFTPLLRLYLLDITGVTPDLAGFIIPGVVVGLLTPALQGVQSWQRGVLMTGYATGDVYWGMGLNLLVTAAGISLGVWGQTPGVPAAATALTGGMVVEMLFLAWRVRPVQARLQLTPEPARV